MNRMNGTKPPELVVRRYYVCECGQETLLPMAAVVEWVCPGCDEPKRWVAE